MTLDEAEQLARDEVDDPVTPSRQRQERGAMRAYHLARFILAVMPVLREVQRLDDGLSRLTDAAYAMRTQLDSRRAGG